MFACVHIQPSLSFTTIYKIQPKKRLREYLGRFLFYFAITLFIARPVRIKIPAIITQPI